ncbi:MAG: ABC transporter permease [Acidobacteriota bacterium]
MAEAMKFSMTRLWAIVVKEFIQMRRDRLTFGMMIGIPIVQLILFGFAINMDPKNLPTAILLYDEGPYGRTILYAIKNSGYFDIKKQVYSEEEAEKILQNGEVQFVINIPVNFSRDLLRGDKPHILIEIDATDPAAVGYAISSVKSLTDTVLEKDIKGPLNYLKSSDKIIDFRMHARYNPENITQYNVVPGLMGVVLTMTMVIITGLAITRERERGTMENLLSMPTLPLEVLVGKILPYIFVGYIQVLIILSTGIFLFKVPMVGSYWLLLAASLPFITANLAIGVTFSTLAKNQLQAVQMAFFFFLPSIMLSGFMFPFRGMPHWAQYIGEILPLTHFLRIVRGVMLKGNGIEEIVLQIWQIALFALFALVIALIRYSKTLD